MQDRDGSVPDILEDLHTLVVIRPHRNTEQISIVCPL